MAQSLAVKYRPKTWKDVTEQDAIKVILQNQLETGEIRHAYLFCGGAGTGKTTCARIFANEINNGAGNPIEMDAASNNSVDDIRMITDQAKTRSLDSEYKIFILDECHSLSNSAWQAMLKLIEEPPAKSIFIFCTTDPQKIPKTILSRVQRYDFQRISQQGIIERLEYILKAENLLQSSGDLQDDGDNAIDIYSSLEYIAKVADGGMRDAISLLDKCLAFSTYLDLNNVVKALGMADYHTMKVLTEAVYDYQDTKVLDIINAIHASGKDLKQFIRQYLQFVLDLTVYHVTKAFEFTTLPATDEMKDFQAVVDKHIGVTYSLLDMLMKLHTEIKWDSSPKTLILSRFLLFIEEEA